MQLAVMDAADRDGELVAHSASKSTRLRKRQVMRIRRHAAADKARLPQNESAMVLIAQTDRLAESTDGAVARPLPGSACSLLAVACIRPSGGHYGLLRDSMRRP